MITIFTKENCPYCVKAKALIGTYNEVRVGIDISVEEFKERYNVKTVPLILTDYTDLANLVKPVANNTICVEGLCSLD